MVIVRPCIYNPVKEISAKHIYDGVGIKDTSSYGAAIDIGTTTVVLGFFSLDSKKHLADVIETNPQTRYGADVMMRIMHANMGKSALLHELITRQVEDMLEHASKGICMADDIKELAVTGNTTMCHIFLNRDLSKMAGAPFMPAYEGSVSVCGKDIGLRKYPHLNIYVLPGAAAHIGADAVSVLCSQKMYEPDKVQLAIDIGTNAEILLNNKGKIYACSAAAGPAFEGKGTKCGIKACHGAINGIKISRSTGNILLDVLDSRTEGHTGNICQREIIPRGICGSGLVDAVAELLKAGVLSNDGYLMERDEAIKSGVPANIAERLEKDNDGSLFVFYSGKDSHIQTGSGEIKIVVTQKDIRSIQLAKAAIQAGTEILLAKAGVCMANVYDIKIAGVFGKFIHPKSAIAFGLYPDTGQNKIIFTGNAAGIGAAMALLDKNFRKLAEKYAKQVKHIELADEDAFKNKFLSAMELKKW